MPTVATQARSIRALLVGDDQKRLLATRDGLQRVDGNLEIATEATARVLSKPPRNGEYDCVVLCDGASMPLFVDLVNSMKRMRGMPFIVYSGDRGSDSLLLAFRMGVSHFVVDGGGTRALRELAEKMRGSVEAWRDSIRDAVVLRILNAVNRAETPKASVEAVLEILKGYTDAEALAIRLRSKGDYPYYATLGFPKGHVALESSLVVKGSVANLLDCMCGHVIQRRTDPRRPFFTPAGSFWTGSSAKLVQDLGDEASTLLCRGNCLREGYESIALIPLKNGSDTIGLLQVNDRRSWVVNLRVVSFLEELTAGISLALTKADAERATRESEELFRALLENSNDPISISVDNVIVYANRRRAELSGFSDPSKLVGRNRADFALDEDAEMIRQMGQEGTHSLEAPHQYEYKMKTGDGSIHYIEASYTPIVFHGQSAAINILRDVTESRRYQEKISALHSHAAALASADSLRPIVKTTLDACQRVLGFKLLSLLIVEKGALVAVGSRGVRPPAVKLSVEGKGITTRAARERRTVLINDTRGDSDFVRGSIASQSEMAVPVVVAGETAAVINVEDTRLNAFSEMDRVLLETLASHVATALYRLRHLEEDAKAQAERTRELLESANRVTAMVRHDLRGPLQTIRSASFLVRSDPSKAEMLSQTIDQSVDYATKILDDLRTNTTPVEVQKSLVNLKDIVEDRVKMAPLGEGVRLKTSFETEFLVAAVDPDRIRRVMDNLLKNAVEAMPSGGTLTVRVKRVGTSAVIEVADTGTGIPPEVMANLFKPFYSNKKSGTGLGLAFSKQAVEAHGGKISVKTRVGRGTTFRVTLPLTPPRAEPTGVEIPKPRRRPR